MADESLIDKIHDLSDLELATLICLVAQEHCIIDTEPNALDELVQELELVRFHEYRIIAPFTDGFRWQQRSSDYPMQ
jgi:hypothetical protein